MNNSIHFQLGLFVASLGVIISLLAQHMYSLPAYAFSKFEGEKCVWNSGFLKLICKNWWFMQQSYRETMRLLMTWVVSLFSKFLEEPIAQQY